MPSVDGGKSDICAELVSAVGDVGQCQQKRLRRVPDLGAKGYYYMSA